MHYLIIFLLLQTSNAAVINLDWHLNLDLGTTSAVVGDTVVWTWTDEASHSIQSLGSPSFSSSVTKTGAGSQHSNQFKISGSYAYNCAVHGNSMKGVISVTDQPTSSPTGGVVMSAQPSAQPTAKTAIPSSNPTSNPTSTISPSPVLASAVPSLSPTAGTESMVPTADPTLLPTADPTLLPTVEYTEGPTLNPSTATPSTAPTIHLKYRLPWGTSSGEYITIRITVGDAVVWTWADSAPHDVRSVDGQFESSPVVSDVGYKYEVTFVSVGTYPFDCSQHPTQMKGIIIVRDEPDAEDPDKDSGNYNIGTATIVLISLICIMVTFHAIALSTYLFKHSPAFLSMFYLSSSSATGRGRGSR